jgi:opacity protein-like surface antigen
MKGMASGLAALVALGGTALAADPTVYVPPEVPAGHHFVHQGAFDWTGWYLGGYVGHVSGSLTGDQTDPAVSGIDGGAQIHYNMMMDGNWVLSPFVILPIPGALGDVQFRVDWALIGGARIGYAHGRLLPYAFLAGEVAGVTSVSNGSNTHAGLVAGGGVEYAVDERWTIGARYAYISMGPQDYGSPFPGSIGWQGHSLAATLNFKLH